MNGIQLPAKINTIHILKPRLDQYYPVLEGLMDVCAQQKINKRIYDLVYELIREQGYYENPLTDITATYEIKTNERSILSLSLINYAFSGGAHGLTIVKSLTADTKTGEFYELKDLFKNDVDYVGILSGLIKEHIKNRNIILLDDFNGINPEQDFYIANKCLIIYFQLYKITPYVFGFPCFPISVYKIQDIINNEGPLNKMVYGF